MSEVAAIRARLTKLQNALNASRLATSPARKRLEAALAEASDAVDDLEVEADARQ